MVCKKGEVMSTRDIIIVIFVAILIAILLIGFLIGTSIPH